MFSKWDLYCNVWFNYFQKWSWNNATFQLLHPTIMNDYVSCTQDQFPPALGEQDTSVLKIEALKKSEAHQQVLFWIVSIPQHKCVYLLVNNEQIEIDFFGRCFSSKIYSNSWRKMTMYSSS